MSRLTLPKERKIDYAKISEMRSSEVREFVLQDETSYVALFQDMSIDLLDMIDGIEDYGERKKIKEFFDSPGVFDGLVNVLDSSNKYCVFAPAL